MVFFSLRDSGHALVWPTLLGHPSCCVQYFGWSRAPHFSKGGGAGPTKSKNGLQAHEKRGVLYTSESEVILINGSPYITYEKYLEHVP